MADHVFMKRLVAAALNSGIALRSKKHRCQKDDNETTFCEAISYLLETYETDDLMAETGAGTMLFKQPSNESLMEYAEAV